MRGTRRAVVAAALALAATSVLAAPRMTRADVQAVLRARSSGATPPGPPAAFAGWSLDSADLHGLDLAGADFSHANLFAANLSDANLTGANLSGARLDLAWLMRTNLTRANLAGALLHGPVVAPGMADDPKDAPILVGANLSGAKVIARLNGNAEGANFAHADLGADIRNQSMGMLRTDFSGANLRHARFTDAMLSYALMRFADLTGADLRGARLIYADLSGADLTGADLTGADLTHADLTDAILRHAVMKGAILQDTTLAGVKGLDTVKGNKPRAMH